MPRDQISTLPSYCPSSMARITSGAILQSTKQSMHYMTNNIHFFWYHFKAKCLAALDNGPNFTCKCLTVSLKYQHCFVKTYPENLLSGARLRHYTCGCWIILTMSQLYDLLSTSCLWKKNSTLHSGTALMAFFWFWFLWYLWTKSQDGKQEQLQLQSQLSTLIHPTTNLNAHNMTH